MNTHTLFDFKKDSSLAGWSIVDDVVMGGRSAGHFKIYREGHGEFYGTVSLENNGGFSSVRYAFDPLKLNQYSKVVIRLKGDGKNYQIRLKDNRRNYYSYVSPFVTSTDWQDIEIPFNTFYPAFRGRRLNAPNFSGNEAEEIAILIGNKKPESFHLTIDHITFN